MGLRLDVHVCVCVCAYERSPSVYEEQFCQFPFQPPMKAFEVYDLVNHESVPSPVVLVTAVSFQ